MLAVLNESHFDFGVDAAHREFNSSIATFSELLQLDVAAPSLRAANLLLSTAAGVVVMLLFYPQLKTARCSLTGVRRFSSNPVQRVLLVAVDALPVLVLISFMPGLSRHLAVKHAGLSDRYVRCLI
jgi:hypothetical protein